MKKKCLFIFILFVIFFPIKVFALNEVNLYLFWGDGCPHCEDEMTFLNELEQRYTNIRIYKYETWYNKDNKEHLKNVRAIYGNNNTGVPFTVIGDEYVSGFSNSRKKSIEELVRKYSLEDYEDKTGSYFNIGHSTTLEGNLPDTNVDNNQNSDFNNNLNDNNNLNTDSNDDNIDSLGKDNDKESTLDDKIIITLVLLILTIALIVIYLLVGKRKK